MMGGFKLPATKGDFAISVLYSLAIFIFLYGLYTGLESEVARLKVEVEKHRLTTAEALAILKACARDERRVKRAKKFVPRVVE